ncbi:MAG: anaerobic glycerol-3-phosphate dehydrogenase subunit B [Bacteroidales bacterium]|nr:anaerobic glycerol-3-phosphate dehydrogenase subunit B [Bacteroidales bacterium]
MKFDTVITGGGLAGLIAGISLQKEGRSTAIVSAGQNALHFFSGSFESMKEAPARLQEILTESGVRVHYSEGVRLMPMGTFKESALSLDDISLLPSPLFAKRALIVSFLGYHDFFSSFIADGLSKQGIEARTCFLRLPEMERLRQSPSEMRSVQIARTMDRIWEKVVQEIRLHLKNDDTVILPQVFGLQDISVPGRIREALPAKVVFVGTLPPSVPGLRTQMQLKRRYETLGGTFLMGDQVISAHIHDGVVHSVATHNLGSHYLEADNFILATGSFFSKGLISTPERVYEPIIGLDVKSSEDRNTWYDPDFAKDQPYMDFGVVTDQDLHPLKDGQPVKNMYAIGSVLGNTRPELGTGAGASIRSAFTAVDKILSKA